MPTARAPAPPESDRVIADAAPGVEQDPVLGDSQVGEHAIMNPGVESMLDRIRPIDVLPPIVDHIEFVRALEVARIHGGVC